MPLSHCQGGYSFTSYELLCHKVFVLRVVVAYRFSDIKFHKARGRKPSKSYIVVRRRGFRPITQ